MHIGLRMLPASVFTSHAGREERTLEISAYHAIKRYVCFGYFMGGLPSNTPLGFTTFQQVLLHLKFSIT
jgi:hypothetical protein